MDTFRLFLLLGLLSLVVGSLSFVIGRKDRISKLWNNKYKYLVAANSEWYQRILDLNNETKYYTEVMDNGRSAHYIYVDSKAKYDRENPINGLYEFLELHREEVGRALEQVYRNRVINEVYRKKFESFQSHASPEQCKNLKISFKTFLKLEKEIVREARLPIVYSYSITCYVHYTSPQGRNSYSKRRIYDEEFIRSAIEEMNRKSAYQSSEEWRRKNERAKVTPSLRYNVMKRDNFRCRLCGRSAEKGVELEVDHIVPVSKGGSTTYSNLQTLCRDCNRGKGAKV